MAGAVFSLREGIDELIHPSTTSSFVVAYVVLAISAALDLLSFRQSAGQLARRARHYQRTLLEETTVTSDPTLRAVFSEDTVSIFGDVIAFAALALNQITGSSIPEGITAVVIALLSIRVSLRLIRRRHDFLVGVWTFVLGYPGVTAIRELLFTFVGPNRLWLVVRVNIQDDLDGAQLKALVRGIESGLKSES